MSEEKDVHDSRLKQPQAGHKEKKEEHERATSSSSRKRMLVLDVDDGALLPPPPKRMSLGNDTPYAPLARQLPDGMGYVLCDVTDKCVIPPALVLSSRSEILAMKAQQQQQLQKQQRQEQRQEQQQQEQGRSLLDDVTKQVGEENARGPHTNGARSSSTLDDARPLPHACPTPLHSTAAPGRGAINSTCSTTSASTSSCARVLCENEERNEAGDGEKNTAGHGDEGFR